MKEHTKFNKERMNKPTTAAAQTKLLGTHSLSLLLLLLLLSLLSFF
jgi:hypothetical protein